MSVIDGNIQYKQLTYGRLWCAHAEGELVIDTKRSNSIRSVTSVQHNWLLFLNICLCQRGCFKKVEKSTVSLSYIIHQVAITAADRKVYPSRPCVLPASAKVRVTVPPDWTLSAQPLNISVCTACCRPWGFTERREWRIDVKRGVWDSPGWLWLWHSLLNMTVILLDIKRIIFTISWSHIYCRIIISFNFIHGCYTWSSCPCSSNSHIIQVHFTANLK